MNATAAILLGLAVAIAPVNWWSRATSHQRLEYVTKPVVTGLVTLAAVAITPVDEAMRWWFVAAFIACLAGDVLLMLPRDLFIAGLGAFLIGHLLFVVGFLVAGTQRWAALLLGVAVVVAGQASVGRTILAGAARQSPRLVPPVGAYLVVISAMVVAAFAHGAVWGVVGALAFYVSDALLGFDRFVDAFPAASVAVMVTYHLALVALLLALV